MSIAQKIAEFVYKTQYVHIPPQVIDKAKQCLLDSIGVAIYGSRFEASRISQEVIRQIGSVGKASILGTCYKSSSPMAAMANALRGHVADYDDSQDDFGHPSCILMPVTLALSESINTDGRNLLTSFILGNEAGSKLGRIMGWKHYETGWHSTGTIGTIGAAVAAAKLLNLSPRKIINAIGIAASSASGLRQNFGTMTKCWHAGHAAFSGVTAALLAQKGYDASPGILEGKSGFIHAFQGVQEATFNEESLGSPYSIMKVMFKKYPSCHGTHAFVDAVLRLKVQYGFHPKEIEAIECYGRPLMVDTVLVHHNPKSELEAKFSVEFCVAAALVFDWLGVAQFTDVVLFNTVVRALMKKVSLRGDPGLEELAEKEKLLAPGKVKIVLKDGRELTQTILEASGGPRDPISWEILEKKFSECSGEVLSVNQIQKTIGLIHQLEKIENLSQLTEYLKPIALN